ncbi:RNA polymerase sigma factor [Brevibacillus brevis]|uniref:RNA polymerase sigma factor n=1 Tax=Brevibacillus brevis TaxID=1393 RepID=UPI000D0FFC22|nr:RNA polymerase sigma factor [Brevibacillus brevis]PSJ63514.1 RNA polymerase subunit sigma-70 [Brevibacillus brevis]RED20982.1 RNA polymerase RpoE-like sigma-24 subunit [Brevibacillus brevis]GEC93473.1 DNA-directed RNA polymerase sigma-70 factor [Brevibacillus brevis]VEF86340.1 RNA polymerase sigma factor sigX [Brevibacillus brevis]
MDDDLNENMRSIYQQHYLAVYCFLLHFAGNQNETEDLTQEVFTRVVKALPAYDGRVAVKTWLFSIAKHIAIDRYRKQKLYELVSENWLMRLTAKNGIPEVELDSKEEIREIKEALQRLKPSYRMVVILRSVEGYSIRETAELLDISEAKVKVIYHRALKKLQHYLKDSLEGGIPHELA